MHLLGDREQTTTDKKGELYLKKSLLKLNDTLFIEYLGFQKKKVVIDNSILKKDNLIVYLKEKEYLLDEVTVVTTNFNAEKYFQKQLKKDLRPYPRRITADVTISYGKKKSKKAITSFSKKNRKIKIDTIRTPKDINLKLIVNNTLSASYWFCKKHYRKKFKCLYKGKEKDDTTVWEFKADKKQKKSLLLNDVDDDLTCLVKLNRQGVITEIKIFLVDAKSKNGIVTEFCKIKYTTFKNDLIAKKVNLKRFREGDKKEDIDLLFYNFHKE